MAAAIKDMANKLKERHPDIYGKASEKVLMDAARDEVVAECCETMLTDTDAAQRIAQRIQQQDKGLLESIVQWFKDFARKRSTTGTSHYFSSCAIMDVARKT